MPDSFNFQSIPYVGPQTEKDLHDLGFTSLEQVARADPEGMYTDLCVLRGRHIDRCQLYVFRMVAYFAKGGRDERKMKWWEWKDN